MTEPEKVGETEKLEEPSVPVTGAPAVEAPVPVKPTSGETDHVDDVEEEDEDEAAVGVTAAPEVHEHPTADGRGQTGSPHPGE